MHERDDRGHQAERQAGQDEPDRPGGVAREAERGSDQQQGGEERCGADVDAPREEEARRDGTARDLAPVAHVRCRRRHEDRRPADCREPPVLKRRADHGKQRAAQQQRPALAERPVVVARDEPEDPHHEEGRGERQRQDAERGSPGRLPKLERGLAWPGSQAGRGERQALAWQRAQSLGVHRLACAVAHHAAVATAGPREREGGDASEQLADAAALPTSHARPFACLGGVRRAWTTRAADASRSASATTASRPPSVSR